jgi:hypothetical protein
MQWGWARLLQKSWSHLRCRTFLSALLFPLKTAGETVMLMALILKSKEEHLAAMKEDSGTLNASSHLSENEREQTVHAHLSAACRNNAALQWGPIRHQRLSNSRRQQCPTLVVLVVHTHTFTRIFFLLIQKEAGRQGRSKEELVPLTLLLSRFCDHDHVIASAHPPALLSAHFAFSKCPSQWRMINSLETESKKW